MEEEDEENLNEQRRKRSEQDHLRTRRLAGERAQWRRMT